MLLICIAHNCVQPRCFALLTWCTPNLRKQLSRTNFATEQNEWLGKHCPDCINKDSGTPNSPDLNPLTTTCGEPGLRSSGSWNQTAECNRPETTPQTIWNDLSDETIRKSVLSFCRPLMTCVKAQGGHSNIRLIDLFSDYHRSLASWAHETFRHLFFSVANLWDVRYLDKLLISEHLKLTLMLPNIKLLEQN